VVPLGAAARPRGLRLGEHLGGPLLPSSGGGLSSARACHGGRGGGSARGPARDDGNGQRSAGCDRALAKRGQRRRARGGARGGQRGSNLAAIVRPRARGRLGVVLARPRHRCCATAAAAAGAPKAGARWERETHTASTDVKRARGAPRRPTLHARRTPTRRRALPRATPCTAHQWPAFRPALPPPAHGLAPCIAFASARHSSCSDVAAPGARLCRGQEQRIHRSVPPAWRWCARSAPRGQRADRGGRRPRAPPGRKLECGPPDAAAVLGAQGHGAGRRCTGRSVPPRLPVDALTSCMLPRRRARPPGRSAAAARGRIAARSTACRTRAPSPPAAARSVRCGCSPSTPTS
jgi:hypothetical protein